MTTRRIRPRELFLFLLGIIVISTFFYNFPLMYATHYEYIKRDGILIELVRNTTKNLSSIEEDCVYDAVINDTSSMEEFVTNEINWDGEDVKIGGEYIPPYCKPLFSVAIIVPYRQREIHLRKFLMYMHTFLRKQRLHYRIYIVEQDNSNPFNRAKLFNIGALYAIKAGFPCLILHDVDLLPLKVNNIYACTKRPRHLSSSIGAFRYNLPYDSLFGGAVSIQSKQFIDVNGMSNVYDGWGGEDDDFYKRIASRNLRICRFEPRISMYEMLGHTSQAPNPSRNILLATALARQLRDGLNSLKFKEKSIKLHPLFTHIIVDFKINSQIKFERESED